MIVEGLLTLVKSILFGFFGLFNFPALPSSLHTVLHDVQFMQAMASGVSVVATYTHFSFLLALFVFCIAIDAAEHLYKFMRWLLRKIPFLGIS